MSIIFGIIVAGGLVTALVCFTLGGRKVEQPKAGIDRPLRELADIAAINKGVCPDCGQGGVLLSGPNGGMSQNVLCNSCLMEFNVHYSFGTGALGVDRTGKADESRARVFGVEPQEHRQIEDRLYREALP